MVATSEFDSVDILACMDASNAAPAVKAKACAAKGKLPFDKIIACFSGAQGTDLVKAASEYFDGRFPQPQGVPHVEIDGKAQAGPPYNYAALIKSLCAKDIQAGACNGSNQTVVVSSQHTGTQDALLVPRNSFQSMEISLLLNETVVV